MSVSFDPSQLITILTNINQNIRILSLNPDVMKICEYCGVSFEARKVEENFWIGNDDGLNGEQRMSLKTFQENLIHFFDYYDKFMKTFQNHQQKQQQYQLLNNIANDFEGRAIQVFQMMTLNFALQFSNNKSSPRRSSLTRSNSDFIRDLCSGDPEKTLKLVPSRELARDLGISDIQLRREIYLARQRVLNKRPAPKRRKQQVKDSKDFASKALVNDNQNFEIPTCASPPSSSNSFDLIINENYDAHNAHNDDDNENCLMVTEVDDGWTVVKGWLNSDLIDY